MIQFTGKDKKMRSEAAYNDEKTQPVVESDKKILFLPDFIVGTFLIIIVVHECFTR